MFHFAKLIDADPIYKTSDNPDQTYYQKYYQLNKYKRLLSHREYQWKHPDRVNASNRRCKAHKKIWAELSAIDESIFS
jgi:hypothetical protein